MTGTEKKGNRKQESPATSTGSNTVCPQDVFDSSKYNAMSDMAASSKLEPAEAEILKDAAAESLERVQMTTARGKLTSDGTSAKLTPMVAEERARTIREVNEEMPPVSFDMEKA